jgi:hypothetical protein
MQTGQIAVSLVHDALDSDLFKQVEHKWAPVFIDISKNDSSPERYGDKLLRQLPMDSLKDAWNTIQQTFCEQGPDAAKKRARKTAQVSSQNIKSNEHREFLRVKLGISILENFSSSWHEAVAKINPEALLGIDDPQRTSYDPQLTSILKSMCHVTEKNRSESSSRATIKNFQVGHVHIFIVFPAISVQFLRCVQIKVYT